MKAWPKVALGDVLKQDIHYLSEPEPRLYPKLSVKLYGRGAVLDTPAYGGSVKMRKHQLARPGQVILSEIWAKKGAIGIVPPEGEGALCTSHFFLFDIDESKALSGYVGWLLRGNYFEPQLNAEARGTTGYAAIRPKQFLGTEIPLPPLTDQQTLVARLDALAEKTRQVEAHLEAVERDAEHLLALRFRDAIANAPLRPMAEVAPLVRREVVIDPEKSYTELGVRSFYKGTFHRRTVPGSDFSWQGLYRVQAGDLIFSNIMAWEQAIAIAQPEDEGCVGNHRMLTCEANAELAVPGFLWYYFTTEEGFAKIYAASPGTAARNRTMTAPALMAIEVPIPPLVAQQTFDRLQTEIAALKAKHTAIRQANAALLPATLERVFTGSA